MKNKKKKITYSDEYIVVHHRVEEAQLKFRNRLPISILKDQIYILPTFRVSQEWFSSTSEKLKFLQRKRKALSIVSRLTKVHRALTKKLWNRDMIK